MAEQTPWAVLGLIGVGVVAWWYLRDDGGETSNYTSDDTPKGKGWYVLKYDQVDNPKFKGKGRLKDYDGPYDSKGEAKESASDAREEGWNREGNARAAIQHRSKAPW